MVKKKKSKIEKKTEKDLLYLLGFFAFLIILFLVASSVFEKIGKVDYEGVTFSREDFGEIEVYHTSYVFKAPSTGQLIRYNLFVRTNPEENDIPLEGDKIEYEGGKIYLTYSTAYLDQCEQFVLATADISRFYSDNQLTVLPANMNIIEAEVRGQEYATCENNPGDNVVQIHRGEGDTRIVVDGQCIDLIVGDDCKILEAVEKLKVHSYLDSQIR